MGPMPERIPDESWHGLCISEKLLVRLSTAGDVALRDAVGPHRPPLIVISA